MYTCDFGTADCRDVRRTGGKAASLADMTAAGLPVAPGFAVTAEAYRAFLDQGAVRAQLTAILDELGGRREQDAFDEADRKIAALFGSVSLPADVAAAVRGAYADLCATTGVDDIAVAVRSSATAEDSVGASFAGEFETWIDIVGADAVLAHVHKCYVSVYSGRVLSYLAEKDIDPNDIEMAVVVQKTVRARSAGVMFTISPTTGDRSTIVLEAGWGLGLAVVGGEITPDRFLVDKIGMTVVERVVGDKRIEYRRGDAPRKVPDDRIGALCLDDDEVLALAELGRRLETMHGAPQDIEFAIDEELEPGRNLLLLQCRPETVWSGVERAPAFDTAAGLMGWITHSVSGAAPVGAHDTSHKH